MDNKVSNIPEQNEYHKVILDPKNQIIQLLARMGFYPVSLASEVVEWKHEYGVYSGRAFIEPRTFDPVREYYDRDIWQYHYTDGKTTVFVYEQDANSIFEENIFEVSFANKGDNAKALQPVVTAYNRIRKAREKANNAIADKLEAYKQTPEYAAKKYKDEASDLCERIESTLHEHGYNVVVSDTTSNGYHTVLQHRKDYTLVRFMYDFNNSKGDLSNMPEHSYHAEKPLMAIAIEKEMAKDYQQAYDKLCEVVTESRMDAMVNKIAAKRKKDEDLPF